MPPEPPTPSPADQRLRRFIARRILGEDMTEIEV